MENRLRADRGSATGGLAPFGRILDVEVLLSRGNRLAVGGRWKAYNPPKFDAGFARQSSVDEKRTSKIGKATVPQDVAEQLRVLTFMLLGLLEKILVRRDTIRIQTPRRLRQGLTARFQQRYQVPDQDVLEHITADRVDDRASPVLVYNMHHPGLLLVALGAFVVEAVQIKRDPRAYRNRTHNRHVFLLCWTLTEILGLLLRGW